MERRQLELRDQCDSLQVQPIVGLRRANRRLLELLVQRGDRTLARGELHEPVPLDRAIDRASQCALSSRSRRRQRDDRRLRGQLRQQQLVSGEGRVAHAEHRVDDRRRRRLTHRRRERRRVRQPTFGQRAQPDLERDEPPQQVAVIAAAGAMLGHEPRNRVTVDVRARSATPARAARRADSGDPRGTSERAARRSRASGGTSTRGGTSPVIASRSSHLPDAVALLHAAGQRHREFHDVMVEQRHARLERDRHAHAIDLRQDVARKVRRQVDGGHLRQKIAPRHRRERRREQRVHRRDASRQRGAQHPALAHVRGHGDRRRVSRPAACATCPAGGSVRVRHAAGAPRPGAMRGCWRTPGSSRRDSSSA